MKLIIYDVSAIINSGTRALHSKKYNVGGIPTGGLYKLLGYLVKDIKEADNDTVIVACLDSKLSLSKRREYVPTYKANRGLGDLSSIISDINDSESTDDIYKSIILSEYLNLPFSEQEKIALASNVNIQLRICSEWLPRIGVITFKRDGFEADDLIYSTVIGTADKAPSVTIRADDSDLYDCVFYNKNTIMQSVSGRGTIIPYSGVLVGKIFNGDTSDNIPKVPGAFSNEIQLVQRAICDGIINPFMVHNIDFSKNTNLLDQLDFDPYIKSIIIDNAYCVMPFLFDVKDFITTNNFNMDELYELIATLRMKTLAKKLNKPLPDEFSDSNKDLFYRFKQMLPVFTTKYFGSKLYDV